MTDAKFRDTLLRQREAIVEFGRMALRTAELQPILNEACRLCGEALGTELSKVMELQNDGKELLVVAGIGWRDGVVGKERIPALPESSEGYALYTGVPAVSENIQTETDFDYAEFLKQHGVKALVNVIIPGAEGPGPYGLLQVDSRKERQFTDDDIEFLQGYANIIGAAVERIYSHRALTDALEAKERLHRELQHRVMNNLAILSSMMRMRASKSDHPVLQQHLQEVENQIKVLAELHKKLFAASSANNVDLGGYLSSLCSGLATIGHEGTSVEVETQIEPVLADADVAIPLGIVTNEFVTNSLKHCDAETICSIGLKAGFVDNDLEIQIEDNGPGLGAALEKQHERHSGSGLGLIEGMLRQIGGEWSWNIDDGTRLNIVIRGSPKLAPKKEAAL